MTESTEQFDVIATYHHPYLYVTDISQPGERQRWMVQLQSRADSTITSLIDLVTTRSDWNEINRMIHSRLGRRWIVTGQHWKPTEEEDAPF